MICILNRQKFIFYKEANELKIIILILHQYCAFFDQNQFKSFVLPTLATINSMVAWSVSTSIFTLTNAPIAAAELNIK